MKKWLKRKIDNHHIISFDIFDTALVRNVSKPSDVFKIVQKIIDVPSFFSDRMSIESKICYEKKLISPTFDDIYYDFYDNNVKNIEIGVERQLLQANDEIMEIFNYCLFKKKTIIFISDMYMSSNLLTEILKEKGYHSFKKVYSSCDYNITKSNGGLFDIVINDLKCNGSDILHFGDSVKSDYFNPKIHRIHSILYKNSKSKKHMKFNSIEENIFNSFIKNNRFTDDYFYRYGFDKFGILLFSFSNWLIGMLKELDIKNVFFLSRDGYLMKDCFDIINKSNIKSHYLYVSRRSLTVPNLWKNSKFEDLKDNITISNYFNIETFLKRLGLEPKKYIKKLEEYDLDLSFELTNKTFFKNEKLHSFYNSIEKDVIKNSKKEYDLLVKYLKQNSFSGRVAIVDIGWHGTMQSNLLKICSDNCMIDDLYGFYFGQEKIVSNGFGFLFNESDNLNNKITISGAFGLFETFYLGNHGSVKKYKNDKNAIVPVLEQYEFQNEKSMNNIISFQRGCLDFCNKFSKIEFLKYFNFSSNLFFNYISYLLTNPSLNDVKMFGKLKFNDTYNQNIVCYDNFFKYIFNLSKLKYDFYKSVWKIGFIKKLFKIRLPYFKIYFKLKIK